MNGAPTAAAAAARARMRETLAATNNSKEIIQPPTKKLKMSDSVPLAAIVKNEKDATTKNSNDIVQPHPTKKPKTSEISPSLVASTAAISNNERDTTGLVTSTNNNNKTPTAVVPPSKKFAEGQCKYGDKWPPCKFLAKGQCKYGDKCYFSHSSGGGISNNEGDTTGLVTSANDNTNKTPTAAGGVSDATMAPSPPAEAPKTTTVPMSIPKAAAPGPAPTVAATAASAPDPAAKAPKATNKPAPPLQAPAVTTKTSSPTGVAPPQVVIVPILRKRLTMDQIAPYCQAILKDLHELGIRAEFDDRVMYKPTWKYSHWEEKGVPYRIEVGFKEVKEKKARCVLRYNGEKIDITISTDGLATILKDKLEDIQEKMFAKAKETREPHLLQAYKIVQPQAAVSNNERDTTTHNSNNIMQLQQAKDLKKKDNGTIAVVVVGGQGFNECILLLSSISEYFDVAIRNGMKESRALRFEFPDRDPQEWELLMSICKPFPAAQVTKVNWQVVLPWFDELGILEGVDACDKVLNALLPVGRWQPPDGEFLCLEAFLHQSSCTLKTVEGCLEEIASLLEYYGKSLQYGLDRSKASCVKILSWLLEDYSSILELRHWTNLWTLLGEYEDCKHALWSTIVKFLPTTIGERTQKKLLGNDLVPQLVFLNIQGKAKQAALQGFENMHPPIPHANKLNFYCVQNTDGIKHLFYRRKNDCSLDRQGKKCHYYRLE